MKGRDTSTMQEQMPKHYFVANEIRQHPDKETKKIVFEHNERQAPRKNHDVCQCNKL